MPTLLRSDLRSHALRCLSSALALVIGSAPSANTHATAAGGIAVSNCNDHGSGSLRDAITRAADHYIIDLGALTCSTISLTTGALAVATDNLTIIDSASRKPGDGTPAAYYLPPPRITIDGGGIDRVFDHVGHGDFELRGVALQNGAINGNGGCVSSAGSLVLRLATVSGCIAHDLDYAHGKGGGAYAAGNVTLVGAHVSGNHADGHLPRGGGVFAGGDFSMQVSTLDQNTADGYLPIGGGGFAGGDSKIFGSTISSNEAVGSDGGAGTAGGLYVRSGTRIIVSTISGNRADEIGGAFAVGYSGMHSQIEASTISGNQGHRVGGILVLNAPLFVFNSTVAFNSAATGGVGGIAFGGGGLLISSIVAPNDAAVTPSDIGKPASRPTAVTIGGDRNLAIAWSPNVTLPANTLMQELRLAPLADNGGLTWTHALLVGSPAIDAGSNPQGYGFDKRFVGYARVVGANADIGAFEYGAVYDFIFYGSFE